jgi:hypothetical protein
MYIIRKVYFIGNNQVIFLIKNNIKVGIGKFTLPFCYEESSSFREKSVRLD